MEVDPVLDGNLNNHKIRLKVQSLKFLNSKLIIHTS
jgi:hypothetical protein